MFWELTDDDLLLAKAADPKATERLFAAALPTCERMALALCGTRDATRRVLRGLTHRSARQLDAWRSADQAGRWFMHHTILLVRENMPNNVTDDALLQGVGGPDLVAYGALISAMRKLPPQQREAFVLTHAQRWNTRLCAVAMDCSNRAVENHLIEANKKIQSLSGEHFDALTSALRQVYTTLPLELPLTPDRLAGTLHRGRRTRRVLRLTMWISVAIALTAAVWFVLHVLPRIDV